MPTNLKLLASSFIDTIRYIWAEKVACHKCCKFAVALYRIQFTPPKPLLRSIVLICGRELDFYVRNTRWLFWILIAAFLWLMVSHLNDIETVMPV